MTNPEMKLPTINSVITKGTNDYPSFSKMAPQGNQVDMRYDAQGTNIQNQPLPQGMTNYKINNSSMYDVSYDSENAKNYNQPNQNVPLQQNYNQPIQNVSLDNSSVGVRQSEFLDQQYCSEKTKYGQTNQNNSYLDKEYTSTGRNQMGQPMNYDYVQPNRPQMYPHFPHHPHHPHFPHYPAPKYPYPYAYA